MENNLNRNFFAAAFLAFLVAGPVMAADPTDAGAVLKLEREQIERLMQERKLQQSPVAASIDLPAKPAATPASREANIPVKRFEFGASDILTANEIRAVLLPYEGRTVSLNDLFDAVDAINGLYAGKRMPTARAFLPPQDLKDGVVQLQLIEARVGALGVESLQVLKPEFVQDRMSLKGGDLMSVQKLEDDLVRFNRLHDTQVRASVKPGSQFGTTDVVLNAVEPPRFQNSVFFDNAGRYTVGENRIGLISHVKGVSGNGDSLVFSATGSHGSNSFFLGYSRPLSIQDLNLDVNLSKGDIKVVEGSFAPLDVTGASRELSVSLSKPIQVTQERLWTIYTRLARKNSTSEFGGAIQQDATLTALTLGSTILQQRGTQSWSADLSLTQGTGSQPDDQKFQALRSSLAWLNNFSGNSQVLLRGALQYSGDALLPSSEHFQLGGSSSVRGFSEGLLSGRSGYLMSAEYRRNVQPSSYFQSQFPNVPRMVFLAFVDHGAAMPYRPSGQEAVQADDYLTSLGIGMQLDWGKRASMRLSVAKPTRDNANETSTHRFSANFALNWP
jgi:hemolysin activation/secretion protein